MALQEMPVRGLHRIKIVVNSIRIEAVYPGMQLAGTMMALVDSEHEFIITQVPAAGALAHFFDEYGLLLPMHCW
eukprot:CAMPEP_0202869352 /NCGR_PEP_ID=MMETSP1391-20130828/12409_1 /ASSEMBLY_ACC=CAM_ASM_000867 /TAXON_ID=1034604 /ORGANISM="Chlamydomonas leiostraca, Strain SAG 11-49" /LENGTH=73 /DNA_ID=CAMNT_0049549665 /DNA_START=282 /DNA_END=503 /DNA_ORIENTATION=+